MKHTSKKSKRGRAIEEAKFDFRDVSTSSESFSLFTSVPWYKLSYAFQQAMSCLTRCSCTNHNESEDESEEECGANDEKIFYHNNKRHNVSARKKKRTKHDVKRKISYYGTVHMNLAQQIDPIVDDNVIVTSANGNVITRPEEIGMHEIRR